MMCKVCGCDKYNKIGEIKGIWKKNKNVYECPNCKLYFIDKPSKEEMEFLYKSDFYIKNNNSIYKFIEAKMKYARALNRFNYIKKFIKDRKSVV